MKPDSPLNPLNILIADDDSSDRYFFDLALKEMPFTISLETVEDGQQLMDHLEKIKELPDMLFLDLNMPRKNGTECLDEIKKDDKLKSLPVIIFSTSLHEDVADRLYKAGAHYYVQKVDFNFLKQVLLHALTHIVKTQFKRPKREDFIVNQSVLQS